MHCALCGLPCHRELGLCTGCEADLERNRRCCRRGALPLPPGAGEALCGDCQRWAPPSDRVVAPWLYDEHLAHLIGRWKYAREQELTPLLARLWRRHANPDSDIDAIVPVPLHWRRRWQRGFSQSALLAAELRRQWTPLRRIPLANGLARRNRHTAPQSASGALQRGRNLRGAFTVTRPCDRLRVAIVDDVLTTGATASALAQALQGAGAAGVEVWCLARTPSPLA